MNKDCLYLDAVCVCLSMIILLTAVVKKQKNPPQTNNRSRKPTQILKIKQTNRPNKTHEQKEAVAT